MKFSDFTQEPFPVKSSKKKNVIVKESDMEGDNNINTENKMDTGDNINMEDKMDTDEKTYNEDNNNDISDINTESRLPIVTAADEKLCPQGDSDVDNKSQNDSETDIVIQSEALKTQTGDSDAEHDFQNPGLLEKLIIESPANDDSDETVPKLTAELDVSDDRSNSDTTGLTESSDASLPSHKEDLCIPDASNIKLPALSEILDSTVTTDESNTSVDIPSSSPRTNLTPVVEKPKAPYKGTMVPCGNLKNYLDSLPTFNRKCMLRKGREVHKIYVDMTKGETFLDDQFAYTEFGRMVLTNGSIRAGRAKNAKQIVVARETLYCSGTAACKRACGGYGICLPGNVSFLPSYIETSLVHLSTICS